MKAKIVKPIIVLLLCILFLTFNNVNAVYALDGSRFFTWLVMFSGIGASFAGAITHGQAERIYDEYLHSAVQSDMNKLIDDYNKKRQHSIIAVRAGIGLTISAVLFSLVDAKNIPQISDQESFGSLYKNKFYANINTNEKDFQLVIRQNF